MKKGLAALLAMVLATMLCALACAEGAYQPGEYTAQAKGYAGYVTAVVTVGENGEIADVKLTGEKETPTVGGYALQDMGKWIVEAQSTDVDAYAGATFTHDAIIAAVDDCLAQAAGGTAGETGETDAAAAAYQPGEYTAQAKGYAGYVTAVVTVGENGEIADVKLTGEKETPTVGGYALQDMGKWIVEAQSTDVDAYAGATFTHDAIIAAVDDCLAQAAGGAAGETGAAAAAYQPGEYTAQAKGYAGYVTAVVTVGESGEIADVKLTGEKETPTVGGYALQDMGKWIVEVQSTDVDAYAGATFTHDAIIAAVNDCLAQAAAAEN